MTTQKTTINTNIESNTQNRTKFIITSNANKYEYLLFSEESQENPENPEKIEEMLINLAYTCSTNKELVDTQCHMLYTLGFGDAGRPINDETIESTLGYLAYEHLYAQDNILNLIKDVVISTIDDFNKYNNDDGCKNKEITAYFDSVSFENETVLVIECFDDKRKEIVNDALYNFELLVDIDVDNYH